MVILIGFIPLFDLFHPGLPLTHDGQDHVARIANFYQNLTEGNIIPRWAGNLNWGYGHPILMFLYPFPSYTASMFHFLGFSLVDSVKIVFGLSFIASGFAMYAWLKEFLGIKAGFVGALLYMFAPYRFVDLYVRGAIGEHVAFVFPPLIFYFLFKLSRRFSKWYVIGGSLSLAGLLLSHNAISLMFLPLIFLYVIYLLWKIKNKKQYLLHTTYYILLGLGLSAFFWFPAFFEGKYTLRDIVTAGEYSSRFTDFARFIYSPWNYGISGQFSLQVGVVHWISIILAIPVIYLLYKKKNNLWVLGTAAFLLFWLSIFIMTPYSRIIWDNISLLQKFQFPWRFMSVDVFATAVLGGLFFYILPNKFKSFVVLCFVVLILFFNKDYWHASGYLQKPDSFFTGIYNGTTDTGESSPIWSIRFMEKSPKKNIEVVSGEANIRQISRRSTIHVYEINAASKSRVLENTLYFPGWSVYVDGKEVDPEFQDPAHRGLMTFYVDEGTHAVSIKFGETKLRLFSNIISGISLAILFFYIILNSKVWRQFRLF